MIFRLTAKVGLVFKVAFAGKDHSDAVLICTGDYLIIFIRAARLDYGGDACGSGVFNIIREWENRVRGHYAALCLFACVFDGNLASMRVLEKAGFGREGTLKKSATKDGKTIDTVLYSLIND